MSASIAGAACALLALAAFLAVLVWCAVRTLRRRRDIRFAVGLHFHILWMIAGFLPPAREVEEPAVDIVTRSSGVA